MRPGLAGQLVVSTAAVATAWAATWSWAGLVAEPFRYFGPGLIGAVLVAVVGAGLRTLRAPWYAALLAQLVVLISWFGHHQHTGGALGGWIPTPGSLDRLVHQVSDGAAQVNKYAAPVATTHAQATVYLLAVSLLLILGVDLIAAGLRRAPWAGLPLIVALTIPISVLDSGLNPAVFVVTGVLFTVLLACVEVERLTSWGRAVTGSRRNEGTDQVVEGSSFADPVLKIAGVTAIGALLLPALVPLGHGVLDRYRDHGSGKGPGGTVTLTNPILDIGRNLVANNHLPLLEADTDAAAPTYLRLTVLDKFTGDTWEPSGRKLDSRDRAQGTLPLPTGVSSDVTGQSSTWKLRTTPNFATSWLPTPYITRQISTDAGDWRYSPGTMDITSAQDDTPTGVSYDIDAVTPSFDPEHLSQSLPAGPEVLGPMTQVPGLAPQLRQIAEQVTASGHSDYERAVLLQDWFRRDGGFTYSLRRAPGNGMAELVRFITVDKVGYCEQFAAAMAVMARSLGIPARVVVGFLSPRHISSHNYTYTTDDLHAWPEIYFSGSGWVRFEPTPATRTGVPPSWTLGQAAIAPSSGTASASPKDPITARPSKRPTLDQGPVAHSSSSQHGTTWWPVVLVLLGLAALVLLAPVLLRRAQRARRFAGDEDPVLAVTALWEELQATAIDLRLSWPGSRSVRTIAAALIRWTEPGSADRAQLVELVDLVERARYSREVVVDEEEFTRGVAAVRTWSHLLRTAVKPGQARMADLMPRSALRRRRREVVVNAPELTGSR
ncbi:MAG: transglutaminaseTgpA domain-containing protein [Marmoricola sp.]